MSCLTYYLASCLTIFLTPGWFSSVFLMSCYTSFLRCGPNFFLSFLLSYLPSDFLSDLQWGPPVFPPLRPSFCPTVRPPACLPYSLTSFQPPAWPPAWPLVWFPIWPPYCIQLLVRDPCLDHAFERDFLALPASHHLLPYNDRRCNCKEIQNTE
jgi:hypothetical protein